MNPEESFRRLEDPENWTFRLSERTDLVPTRRRWPPLAVSFATVAAVAVVGIVVLSVFGIGVRNIENPAAPPLPTATTSPTPTKSTPTAALGSIGHASCSNLLDKSTRAQLMSQGSTSLGDGWTGLPSTFGQDAVFSIADESTLGLQAFVNSGGIACRWGSDGPSDSDVYFAYAPISPSDAAAAETALAKDGVRTVANGITRYSTFRADPGETSGKLYTGDFAFSTDGYWAFGYSPGFTTDVLAEVMRNAPAFQHTLITHSGPLLTPEPSTTCTNLLDASTVSELKKMGWVPTQSSDSPNGEEPVSKYVPFPGAVGIFCVWGPPPDPANGTDASLSFGYGPIRADDSTTVQLLLTQLGASSMISSGITRLSGGSDGKDWAFGQSHWATAFTMGGSARTDQLLSEVIRNAPTF